MARNSICQLQKAQTIYVETPIVAVFRKGKRSMQNRRRIEQRNVKINLKKFGGFLLKMMTEIEWTELQIHDRKLESDYLRIIQCWVGSPYYFNIKLKTSAHNIRIWILDIQQSLRDIKSHNDLKILHIDFHALIRRCVSCIPPTTFPTKVKRDKIMSDSNFYIRMF